MLLKYRSCLLITISISTLHFDVCYLVLEKLVILYSIRADFTDISALPTGIFLLELIVVRSWKIELSYNMKT